MKNYQQLGYAVAVQAIKDFFEGTDKQKKAIIKQLRSPWMNFITNELAWRLAEELETNPKEVRRRFKKAWAEELEKQNENTFYMDLRMEQQEQM